MNLNDQIILAQRASGESLVIENLKKLSFGDSAEPDQKTEYKRFYTWFKRLLRNTESCFQRDILRDSKDTLWIAWEKRAKEFDNYNSGL